MLVLASAVFGLSLFAYGLPLAAFLLVLFLFGIALGVVGVSVVLRFGPAAEWFVWPIPAFVSPFAGVFYPVAALPVWMQWVARLVPVSYVFEGVRASAAGGAASWDALGRGLALAVAYLLASCWFFARVHRRVLRTGLIARYSAESVG
jgi:ABC-2 type transport system permease protein